MDLDWACFNSSDIDIGRQKKRDRPKETWRRTVERKTRVCKLDRNSKICTRQDQIEDTCSRSYSPGGEKELSQEHSREMSGQGGPFKRWEKGTMIIRIVKCVCFSKLSVKGGTSVMNHPCEMTEKTRSRTCTYTIIFELGIKRKHVAPAKAKRIYID